MLHDVTSIDRPSGTNLDLKSPAWFCVHTHLKHEHIAAAHLTRFFNLEVFQPRIHFVRSTRRGPVSATESLFPSYIFVRFDWNTQLNLVQYSRAISEVVHFGSHWPTIADETIQDLRSLFGPEEVRHIPSSPEVGQTVQINVGAFDGLEAVVTRVMPGGQRVAVLLDFLGRQSTVEVKTCDILRNVREEVARNLRTAA